MNIANPRFYCDYINYRLSRGIAQNGNYDVQATHTGNLNHIGSATTTGTHTFEDIIVNGSCLGSGCAGGGGGGGRW